MRHTFWRSWVRVPAPFTGWSFFILIGLKNTKKQTKKKQGMTQFKLRLDSTVNVIMFIMLLFQQLCCRRCTLTSVFCRCCYHNCSFSKNCFSGKSWLTEGELSGNFWAIYEIILFPESFQIFDVFVKIFLTSTFCRHVTRRGRNYWWGVDILFSLGQYIVVGIAPILLPILMWIMCLFYKW